MNWIPRQFQGRETQLLLWHYNESGIGKRYLLNKSRCFCIDFICIHNLVKKYTIDTIPMITIFMTCTKHCLYTGRMLGVHNSITYEHSVCFGVLYGHVYQITVFHKTLRRHNLITYYLTLFEYLPWALEACMTMYIR